MVSDQPTRKVVALLREAGFHPVRTNGSHTVWQSGTVAVTAPDGHRKISPGVYRQVLAAIERGKER